VSDDIEKYIHDSLMQMDEVTSFPEKGIRISEHEGSDIIDLDINVKFGVRIPELAWEIQRHVKHGLEAEFASNIESVNVHIQGVE
jgi:uncharacterized alkaline shock family protein YloU